jgi:hypothetical protein
MPTFSSKKIFRLAAPFSDEIAQSIISDFRNDGFSVTDIPLLSGGRNISIAKGNTFKAVLGMKTALNISIKRIENNLEIEAGVGMYGQQAIPTAISMLLFWPVLLTQIWGMVQQSKLDDRVMAIAESVIASRQPSLIQQEIAKPEGFCPHCGTGVNNGTKFCSECGGKL